MFGRARSDTPLVALSLLVMLSACGGSDGGGGSTTGPQRIPTSVRVTTATGTITALSATLQLSGQVLDEQGGVISGSSLQWTSSAAAVATVSGSGLVTGLQNGTTTVTATASGLSASAAITVQQEAGIVIVTPGSESVFAGATVQFAAAVADANGNEMPEQTASWATSDQAVATVDQTGLAMGVAAGSATITATNGSASGTASLTVLAIPDPLELAADTNLEGEVVASTVTIPAGVTLTATAGLTILASDAVNIAGKVLGGCVEITIDGSAAVSVTGEIQNDCTVGAGAEVPGVTILADADVTVDGALIQSAGDITIANDRTAIATTPAGGSLSSMVSSIARISEQGDECNFTGSTITVANGKDGADGTVSGGDGGNIRLICKGNINLSAPTTSALLSFTAGSGGKGGDANNPDGPATAGKGGRGGDVPIATLGQFNVGEDPGDLNSGPTARVISGAGGRGGAATSGGRQAQATGGRGGEAGQPFASGTYGGAGHVVFALPNGGVGGAAEATGTAGNDATATVPAEAGGSANATGGRGGDSGENIDFYTFHVVGTFPTDKFPTQVGDNGAGGNGGDAKAVGGKGGAGSMEQSTGGAGGNMTANGGDGGNSHWFGAEKLLAAMPGNGGVARFEGGIGGSGYDACSAEGTGAGGNGGKGGNASGEPGDVGVDLEGEEGNAGWAEFTNAGNGGPGGDGTPPGTGGAAGTKTVILKSFETNTGTNSRLVPREMDARQRPPPLLWS